MKKISAALLFSLAVSPFALAVDPSTGAPVDIDLEKLVSDIETNEVNDEIRYQKFSEKLNLVTYKTNENVVSRRYIDRTPEVAGECDERNDQLSFDSTYKVMTQKTVTSGSDTGVDCSNFTIYWSYEDGLKTTYLSVDNGSSTIGITYSPAWEALKNEMKIGESWGAYSAREFSINGSGSYPISSDYHKMTLIGVEHVSTPAGDFNDCVVIEDEARLSSGPDTRLYYFCEGPGLVRWVSLDSGRDFLLQSYTEN